MLLIYYNPKTSAFYLKWVQGAFFDREVGQVNQFDHILIQILKKYNNCLINCNDFFDYINKTRNEKVSIRNRIINKIICLLDRLKKE